MPFSFMFTTRLENTLTRSESTTSAGCPFELTSQELPWSSKTNSPPFGCDQTAPNGSNTSLPKLAWVSMLSTGACGFWTQGCPLAVRGKNHCLCDRLIAWCPRFASWFWTLTWAEEDVCPVCRWGFFFSRPRPRLTRKSGANLGHSLVRDSFPIRRRS